MNSVMLTVVVDNNSELLNAPSEHGLSLHLQSDNHNMLFDAGKSDLVLANLEALGLAAKSPEWIALSHGHYDHTTGVPALLSRYPKAKLHFHPKLLEQKWILDPGDQWRYGGLPSAFFELDALYLQPHQCGMELIPGVFASGSVAGDDAQSAVRSRFFRISNGCKCIDAFPDEQVLFVKTNKGVSIISGCMHTGIEATIKKARELFPQEPFYALVGGLHLEGKTQKEFETILNIIHEANFRVVMPLHCTGKGFVDYLANNNPELLLVGSVGKTIEL